VSENKRFVKIGADVKGTRCDVSIDLDPRRKKSFDKVNSTLPRMSDIVEFSS
jgi:hypothetical protein